MKFIDMFAGIGGFRSGLEQAGHKCIGYIEWDKFARQSYEAMYDTKGEYTAQDIQKVRGEDLPTADAWTFGSPCFIGNTLVQTEAGLKPILDVKNGDKVVTIDGSLQKVINTMVHQSNELYHLKIEGNLEIQLTGNHPIYAKRLERIYFNKKAHHNIHVYDKAQWIPAANLKKGDLVLNYGKVSATHRKHITDEQAWLLGRYVADGYTNHSHRKGRNNSYRHQTIFCIGKKKIDEFRKHLLSYHANESNTSNKNGSVIKFTIYNESFMLLAEEFGRGAINKQIPLWVFTLPLKQRKLFLDGYNSGDGSVVANGTIESTTTISKKLALGYAKLVEYTLNRPASIFFIKTKPTHKIEGRIVHQHDQYSVRYRIVNNGKLLLHSKLINGNLWKPVKTNKREKLDKPINVYNLEVENNHTYNANGIICHNCTNISLAGNRKGLQGEQSRMFFEVIRLLKERIGGEKALPQLTIMENVKNLLSSNGGRDFATVLAEMESVGYDVEWAVLNTADVLPQNRERVYIVGHLRGSSIKPIFPIRRENQGSPKAEKIKVVGNASNTNHHGDDIMDETGISPTINATAYKHTPKIAIHQIGNYLNTNSFGGNPQVGRVYGTDGLAPTLSTMQGGDRQPKILVKPVLTPDRLNKRQNGRRFKNAGDPAFTLTAEDRHGVLIEDGIRLAVRKLTPKECWRLQGFTDEQFDKAKAAGVSNSQLYKQAGNAVSVPVVRAIGEKINECWEKKNE